MKNQLIFLIIYSFFHVNFSFANCPIFVNFDVSCGKADSYLGKFFYLCENDKGSFFKPSGSKLKLLRDHFNAKFNKRPNVINSEYRIPKIIHLIWLGGPLPKQLVSFMYTWRKFHPGWLVILWDEELIEKLDLINKDLYENAESYCEKSDIVRYEILYQFGGLYVDTDFVCLKSFDVFHQCYDFYTGMVSIDEASASSPWLANALIGSVPRHPFLGQLIKAIRKPAASILTRTGPIKFTEEFYKYLPNDVLISIAFPQLIFILSDLYQDIGIAMIRGIQAQNRTRCIGLAQGLSFKKI